MNKNNQQPEVTNLSRFKGINNLEQLPFLINECLLNETVIRTNKRLEYFNTPCAFDIETTSFYENGEKRAIMYEWTLGINGAVVVGRTWEQFKNAVDLIATTLKLSKERRLIIYVHNLSCEFQFFRKWLDWEKVFSVNDRKPV